MAPLIPRQQFQIWPHAVIFDFDGLLVDSGQCWEQAYAASLALAGRRLDPQALGELAGASVSQAAAYLEVGEDELRRQLGSAFSGRMPTPKQGALELVRQLRSQALLAVATNGPLDLVMQTLSGLGIADSFQLVVSAETKPNRHKPSPDVYSSACVGLGVSPRAAVALEDSPVGVTAAQKAGVAVIYVPSDGRVVDDADLCVDDLADSRIFAYLAARER